MLDIQLHRCEDYDFFNQLSDESRSRVLSDGSLTKPAHYGECRHHNPAAGIWPRVNADDWCGDNPKYKD